ncbi:homoserine kinase type II [Rhizobium leguminosarum]|uniref:Homoserine kinase type II n=1 Tax=Rhizobium leguminosarum TaxID=384 RepID=A0AAE2MQQ4_RHILE|nr:MULTISPECIES: phosphotransferase [Rhizobium]ARM91009.1 aminoglycoside phosphotransferase protein [Rhizobium sp. CIAT894]MBB4293677.1 homoserine kinase type II [Rhizobium leguminosarum]MBB4299277.1 homoserine kinase type II [Rhizobium leguminosarum]MBB4310776.1 homoserine kinase type II [Rhizobium leguminosarum]MBB4420112.1 homoserine kinase type II [Rhizobium leguminosarum]
MAVFTEISDEDRNSIAAAYGMTSLSSVIGIADGDRETTYLFRTADGEFIVTLFENGAEPLDLERAFATMEMLNNSGIPCPKPTRTNDGNATFQAAGRLVAIVSFVSGSSTNDPTLGKCVSLGRVMARIHVILQGGQKRFLDELPTGALHGALVRSNVFFLGDEVSGVINFRLRHDDVLISEIADVLVGWTSLPSGALEEQKAQAILAGYESVRLLTEAETAALPAFVLASAASRYARANDKTYLLDAAIRAFESVRFGAVVGKTEPSPA